ncbi:twin-arginine translocase TatA/TatE family subunit [Coraliomargarita sp. SDUM461004]|uniref:Sec-independent protein translocase protein TatA n=1 Tax=Thalassobacterium sedimentorum TaxID=3041258 RepID=A0ABU1AFE7_9BACT|nr:twin-arginine translocase TatA/TatE family subunit [Coraliomargarita sp. SDUM461004]MDQ8193279.1 twin-arginine translocase TatA/TatE family subunit [Coraliomargarita sp. SDUM461004]
MIAFLQNINGPELILIFLVVLLLFGAERLPGLFKSLGQSVREFKKATEGIEEDIRTAMDVEPEPVSRRPVVKPVAQAAAKASEPAAVVEASEAPAVSSETDEAQAASFTASPER